MTANRDALNRSVERWNAGDLDGYLQLYDTMIQLHGYSPEPMHKGDVRSFYQEIFARLPETGMPGPRLDILDIIEADDRIVCRFVMSGTHSGIYMNVPPTGRPYVLAGITILKFAGGKVIERWTSADMLGLLVQFGAIAPPA